MSFISEERNALVAIDRPTDSTAVIHYAPTEHDQKQQSDQGISGLFVVENDVKKRLMLKKKYLTVRKVPRSNRKIVQTEVKSMCVLHVYMTVH